MTENRKILDWKSLKIRHIEYADLKAVNKLMEVELYDVGLKSLQIYYNCSNTKIWKCIENEVGEIFAIDMGNCLPNGVDYKYTLIIHPDYRNQGVSRLFKNQWTVHPCMGSESLKSVSIYSKDVLQCWRGKMLVYYGFVNPNIATKYWDSVGHLTALHQITLQQITADNVSAVCKYDKSIIKIDRKKFVQQWCCSEDSQGVAAVDRSGRCVGYGVLRNFTGHNRWSISPLYADNDDVASVLFGNLVAKIDSQYLYLPCMAHQRVSNHFCKFMNLAFYNCEIRDCNLLALEYMKSIDMGKVYTIHDYWPI